MTKSALLLVDLQNDFCPGGNLAVPGGHEVIEIANQLQSRFDLVIASLDWHPAEHMSFATNQAPNKIGDIITVEGLPQILWPAHCVQDSHGAKFHSELKTEKLAYVVQKGTDVTIDSYSAFFDNAKRRATGLDAYLKEQQVTDLYILGLATDYCVKFSALDAAELGYQVSVITDACRGVELSSGDIAAALNEMKNAGVKLVHSADINVA